MILWYDIAMLTPDQVTTIRGYCERFGVRRLDLFGSAVVGPFDQASSDFDFVVEFHEPRGRDIANNYFGLLFSLEDLLGRPIDLVDLTDNTNPLFPQFIQPQRRVLYAA